MGISNYLIKQVRLHPSMEPQDIIKLCYQAAYGADHLLKNIDTANFYFQEEYSQVEPLDENEPLFEQISDTNCRVNLRAWKHRNIPSEWLFHLFVESNVKMRSGVFTQEQKKSDFIKFLNQARQLVEDGMFAFDTAEWDQYLGQYPLENPVAIHHGDRYREREKPAYRIMSMQYTKLFGVLEALAKIPADSVKIVAIEGRCGSGKTTLARSLASLLGAGIVHMDDFFLPGELRTAERFNEPGGNIHYERFMDEVLPHLRNTDAFAYGRFDCSRMQITVERMVEAGKLRIVEGSYSCHPKFGDYMDIRVFMDVDQEEQIQRLTQRDGESAIESFQNIWIPKEEKYFDTYGILQKADVYILNQNIERM